MSGHILNLLFIFQYLSQWTSKHFIRSHRRCSSFPDNMRPGCIAPKPVNHRKVRESRRSTTLPYIKSQLSCPGPLLTPRSLDRQWQSEPCLLKHSLAPGVKVRSRGRSATATEIKRTPGPVTYHFQSLLSVNYDQKTSRERLSTTPVKQSELSDVDIRVKNMAVNSVESLRDSVELAREANEETCTSENNIESKDQIDEVSSQSETSQNFDRSGSDAQRQEPTFEFISTETMPVEILTVPKRPTNLSLSMTTIGDTVDSKSQVRRSSDTGIQNKAVKLQENTSPNKNIGSYKSEFKPVYTSSPNLKDFSLDSPSRRSVQHSSPRKVDAQRKVATDIPVYEHTLPQATPSYTPSSSLSLSPPCLPPAVPAAYCSLPLSRRTSEVNSFLASSGRFSDPAEELGRENAHFSVSEAMIAAIERAKCERIERGKPSQVRI